MKLKYAVLSLLTLSASAAYTPQIAVRIGGGASVLGNTLKVTHGAVEELGKDKQKEVVANFANADSYSDKAKFDKLEIKTITPEASKHAMSYHGGAAFDFTLMNMSSLSIGITAGGKYNNQGATFDYDNTSGVVYGQFKAVHEATKNYADAKTAADKLPDGDEDGDAAEKAEATAKTAAIQKVIDAAKAVTTVKEVEEKAAKATVTVNPGFQGYFGPYATYHINKNIHATFMVAGLYSQVNFSVKEGENETKPTSHNFFGLLPAVRVTYDINSTFGVFGEVSYAYPTFSSEGVKVKTSEAEKTSETKKEDKTAEKKEDKKDDKKSSNNFDISAVLGSPLLITGGVVVKLV